MDQTATTPKRSELQMARSMCWHCQSEVTGEYFCDRCVKVQPLSKESDYFTCLGLPRLLSIDTADLERRFYDMSRAFHPDFYQVKTDAEQHISLANSALLNVAYRTLKDPVQRAEYLVGLESGSVKDIRSQPPADLFEEILSLQEDLDEYRAAKADTASGAAGLAPLREKLAADRLHLEERQQAMERQLQQLFGQWDRAMAEAPKTESAHHHKQDTLKQLRELLSNRRYLRSILADLADTLDAA
ncbi:MAG: Fe-S protein assembly co-chaperone HscB [Nitrospiraceae bacterium]